MKTSKIYPHIIKHSQEAITWANNTSLYKYLNSPAPVVRFCWPNNIQNERIANLDVEATLQDILSVSQDGQIVEVFNEVAQRQGLGLEQHADFLELLVPKLHAANRKVCGFNFSVGNPGLAVFGDKDDFQYLYNRNFCGVDYIGSHAYWGINGKLTDDRALRYRLMHAAVPSHPPFLLTEAGREPGWKLSVTAETYLDEITNFQTELLRDDYVIGAFIFTSGPTADWLNYSSDNLDTSRFWEKEMSPNESSVTAQLEAQNAYLAQALYDIIKAHVSTDGGEIAGLIQDAKTNINAVNPGKFTF